MNIARHLANTARWHGDWPAVISPQGELSYAELEARAECLANSMVASGLRKGDRVAVLMPNRLEFLEIMFACFRAGFVFVPMHFRLTAFEVSYILSNSGASLFFLDTRIPDAEDIANARPSSTRLVVFDGNADGENYTEFLSRGDSRIALADVSAEDLAWLFYTSGTTGRPKGAMLSHGNLEALALGLIANIDPVHPGDRILHAAPMSHASGLCVLHHVSRGSAHVLLPYESLDPEHVLATVQSRGVTTMFLVPTMIERLLDEAERRTHDLKSLHTVIYGGSPMPLRVLRRAHAVFGPIFVQLYGQGEAPHVLSVLPKSEHRLGHAERPTETFTALKSAGRECLGTEVRIVDDEDSVLPANEIGEVVARSGVVMRGYWHDPAATKQALRGGWLHTGDLGFLDEHGYLFLTDRMKEVIISGGMNVYAREVEEAVHKHPAVREVAVVGVPNDKWGEAVKAFVVLHPGMSASAEEIIGVCQGVLAGYKKPKLVEFLPTLPKGATGKILKRALREKAMSS